MSRMLMNPLTGTVQTEAEWKADFRSMQSEQWGGESFEGAELTEVEWDEASGTWIEV